MPSFPPIPFFTDSVLPNIDPLFEIPLSPSSSLSSLSCTSFNNSGVELTFFVEWNDFMATWGEEVGKGCRGLGLRRRWRASADGTGRIGMRRGGSAGGVVFDSASHLYVPQEEKQEVPVLEVEAFEGDEKVVRGTALLKERRGIGGGAVPWCRC